MQSNRRKFLKIAGLAGIGVTGGGMTAGFAFEKKWVPTSGANPLMTTTMEDNAFDDNPLSIIGAYGEWASTGKENKLPTHSFRRNEWQNLESWRKTAKQRLTERLAIPNIGAKPKVTVKKQFAYGGLHIEELSWQLPYGRPTEAILLKPLQAKGKLPGILAFHDHAGNKYFGCRKITRTSDSQHPLMDEHLKRYYGNIAWANELAKRGYVVLVSDAFAFASRRIMFQDVPVPQRRGLNDNDPESPANIQAYNEWAGDHEHIMAKSLFCAGTTWPGVFFAEDRNALDVLCARQDVDANRIGCGGLSGGGLRTVLMGGLDNRIKCAVDVGFMTTWKDFMMNKSYTHTWMNYIPLLPNELDFPEILGLRVPLPTLVLNDSEDQLYTLPEMNRAEKILREVYKKAKAEDRFKCSYYPGPHKFEPDMQEEAFNWFDRWLKA